MTHTVVLAYSGGLDTSAIVPWLREHYDARVICVAADVGQGRAQGDRGEGLPLGRRGLHRRGRPRALRPRVHLAHAPRRSGLRPHLPPRHLDGAPADRRAAGRRGAALRRPDGGARLHGEGQRPGALRAHLCRPRPRPQGHRPLARGGVDLPRPRGPDRLSEGEGHPDHGHARAAVQPRPEPLARLPRGGHARGSVAGAAGRPLHPDEGPGGHSGRAGDRHRRVRAG